MVAEYLCTAYRESHTWGDMAFSAAIGTKWTSALMCSTRAAYRTAFDMARDTIKLLTLHVSKGLEFPVVALVGAGRIPAEGEDEREEARQFYVGATRATQRLVIGASGSGRFAARL